MVIMELFRGSGRLIAQGGCAATIGNFDGVHLGHQTVIKQVLEAAKARSIAAAVVLFEPHPLTLVAPDRAPVRLTSLREKVTVLRQLGVDKVLCLRFNQQLQTLSAAEFVQRLLVARLKVKHFVVGDDFRFGYQRQGDYAFLQEVSHTHGFTLAKTRSFTLDGIRVSSTAVRQALKAYDLAQAHTLLGRPFSISGRVIHGQRLGHSLGAPTANIALKHQPLPLQGVFAVRVSGIDDKVQTGVANIGLRPTVAGIQPLLEVHLFDFAQDIYGTRLQVEFCHFIRAEQKFADLAQLKHQIAADMLTARNYFAENHFADLE